LGITCTAFCRPVPFRMPCINTEGNACLSQAGQLSVVCTTTHSHFIQINLKYTLWLTVTMSCHLFVIASCGGPPLLKASRASTVPECLNPALHCTATVLQYTEMQQLLKELKIQTTDSRRNGNVCTFNNIAGDDLRWIASAPLLLGSCPVCRS